jgi:signal recognition particle subunit SRP54
MNQDFTLDDFSTHLRNIQKMGMEGMLSRMPGMAEMVSDAGDPGPAMERVQRMIDAMTPDERAHPDRIDAAARERIAASAGVQPEDVSQFLEQFAAVRRLMRQMVNMTLWQRIKMVTGFGRFPPPPAD